MVLYCCLHLQWPPQNCTSFHLVTRHPAGTFRMLKSAAKKSHGQSVWSQAGRLFCWLSFTSTLAGSAATLVLFLVLHPVPAWSVYSVVYTVGHLDIGHASTVAVRLPLSGQLTSVSVIGEPTVSREFLLRCKGTRRGLGCSLPHLAETYLVKWLSPTVL